MTLGNQTEKRRETFIEQQETRVFILYAGKQGGLGIERIRERNIEFIPNCYADFPRSRIPFGQTGEEYLWSEGGRLLYSFRCYSRQGPESVAHLE